jgi:signal transduction histidine kinase
MSGEPGRPLARQLLLPVISLLVVGVLANVAFAAWLAARRHREEVAIRQQQVAATLASSRVSLAPAVLDALHRLTGNHFIVWAERSVVRTTLPGTMPEDLSEATAGLVENLSAAAAATGRDATGSLRLGGTSYSVTSIQGGSMRPETVLVLTPSDGFSRAMLDAIWPVLAVAAATLAVLVPLGVHAADRLVRRISRIERHVGRIADGDFGRTLDDESAAPHRQDEISRLVASVNAMSLALAELRGSLAAGERQRLLGQLAAGFAHEFRNGLTGARLAIDLHASRCRTDDHEAREDESLAVARRQLDIMEEEVHGLLALGRGSESAPCLIAIDVLLDEVRELTEPRAEHAGVRLTVGGVSSTAVRGRRESLRAAVVNLTLNAIDAARDAVAAHGSADGDMPLGGGLGPARHGQVHLMARRHEKGDGSAWVTITVEDTGAGPPHDLEASVFEPFVTGKPEGVGIGLALVTMVADEHGGSISYDRSGGRTRFSLELPEAEAEQDSPAVVPGDRVEPASDQENR